MKWNASDLAAFEARGWSVEEANAQVEQLRQGHRNREVHGACTAGEGIQQWSERERQQREEHAADRLNSGRIVAAFIPASGAATRMFKDLHPPLSEGTAAALLRSWRAFPFADRLVEPVGPDPAADLAGQILDRLQLARLPKGEVPFFALQGAQAMTAFEAHHAEWRSVGAHPLVFTVPVEFVAQLPAKYREWEAVQWDVQDPSTDTLAWNPTGEAVARSADGALHFRPGGHGALLANLRAVQADAAVLRNIDNAVPPDRHAERNAWRTALLGALWHLEDERAALWDRLRRGEAGSEAAAWDWLRPFIRGAERPRTIAQWRYHLDRPLRVAGVVPNAGQPGGGPFWVADRDGFVRPGIVEAAELPAGQVGAGTHFNPVDLAVSFRGLDSSRLDIQSFADPQAYFTAEKVVEGVPLRILERPGLWNGGMAGWLTQFVELPSEVFSPVKTVFDLVR